jgi:hypothetical protein
MPHMPSNTECINGWIEILHFKWDDLDSAYPILNTDNSLQGFKEEHYEVVGSPVPLCEYYSAFELYQQFAVPVDPEFNIPRSFKKYDAINLCMNDPKHGRKVTTLLVYPKEARHRLVYKGGSPQYHPDFPHCLVMRKKPFRAFLPKMRQDDEQ